jgi:hypothetical protein
MDKKTKELHLEVVRQTAIVRYANTKYVAAQTTRMIAGLAIVVGLAAVPEPAGVIIAIISVFSVFVSNRNLKDAYSQLQKEEKTLIDLQKQLIEMQ